MRNSPRVDVIVPYGHSPNQPERQANLQQVLESLQNDLEYENFRVILAELGPRETQRALARSLGADYVFTNSDEEFSPGRAMNAGFLSRQQPADLVYFHQADFLVARDVLDRAVQVKLRLECPFVYPYWGEVHLSRIVSEAVRRAVVQPGQLFDVLQRCVADRRAAEGSEQAASDAYDEVTLSNDELESLVAVLPAGLRREITEADQLRLWGADDRSYAPYRWRPEETLAARLCRISGGPRASAAYLCSDAAFRQAGGVPELPGWGYEDLIFWHTVQAFHPYSGDRRGISFKESAVTIDYPLIHLWHPVSGRPDYYAATAKNERIFHEFRSLAAHEQRAGVRALPPRD
ncbi:hypothetical protein [Streptomyces sp. S.PB5]|uniref:hypothetical protein n=1 Tax=Streptomyces sp. S.PB5 TaxID=3020844 RepID=UPI0025B1143C|nr:hypothetical protein [Streptomyces sp. S.PB5]MDN3025647.1 hypothetical protein [Streptomyces sp. S.PB5]